MKNLAAISIHLSILVFSTLFKTKECTFYSVLNSIARNNLLHFFHTSLLIHVLFVVVYSISDAALNPLSDSEYILYSERMYAIIGDFVLMVSSFSQELDFRTILNFAIFYAFKSVTCSFSIKSQRNTANRVAFFGSCWALLSFLMVLWFCKYPTSGLVLLFILEYSMIALDLLKSLSVLLFNIFEGNNTFSGRTFYTFIISIAYHFIKACSYLIFIALVSVNHKFPISATKSFASTVIRLSKKIRLFLAYLKLSKDLDKIKEVQINGTCAICTDDLEYGKVLKCKHSFHAECLKMWCERETTCPICRSMLVFDREQVVETETEILSGIPVDVEE